MRQAGMMAAAGLYALEHQLERLAEDHQNANRLGTILNEHPDIHIDFDCVQTNLLFIEILNDLDPVQISLELEKEGINIGPFGKKSLRAVTHLDISADDIEEAGQAFLNVMNRLDG